MIAGTEMGNLEKKKNRGGKCMYFTGQDCRIVYFLWGFFLFFVFCFLYRNTNRRFALSFPFSFFKEKNKAGPP